MGDAESFKDLYEVLDGKGDIHGVIQDDAGVLVDDGGDFEPSATVKVVGLGIDRQQMIALLRTGGGAAVFTALTHRYPKPFLTP